MRHRGVDMLLPLCAAGPAAFAPFPAAMLSRLAMDEAPPAAPRLLRIRLATLPAARQHRCPHRLPHLPTRPQDRRTLFNQWKAENGKAYANAAAENAAFAQFSATVNDLVSHNSDGKAKFFKGKSS